MNRYQVIKMLSSDESWNSYNEYLDEYEDLTIYDILDKLDVSREEIDYTESLTFKELGLLD